MEIVENITKYMDHYYEDGWSYAQITRKYGVTKAYLVPLVRAERIKGRKRKVVPKRGRQNVVPFSNTHIRIGKRLHTWREERGVSYTGLGNILGLTRIATPQVEVGCYDLTLLNCIKIADLLGVTVQELMSE